MLRHLSVCPWSNADAVGLPRCQPRTLPGATVFPSLGHVCSLCASTGATDGPQAGQIVSRAAAGSGGRPDEDLGGRLGMG